MLDCFLVGCTLAKVKVVHKHNCSLRTLTLVKVIRKQGCSQLCSKSTTGAGWDCAGLGPGRSGSCFLPTGLGARENNAQAYLVYAYKRLSFLWWGPRFHEAKKPRVSSPSPRSRGLQNWLRSPPFAANRRKYPQERLYSMLLQSCHIYLLHLQQLMHYSCLPVSIL
ncbi:hypothetical protein KSP39_PZI000421 [Platanthera zijinensis]|uniref:Uncharacterized protein n=1 Tax=Platanthera zijinensis TaxID=2320716 RepID=A0AAP0GF64_9ASPA